MSVNGSDKGIDIHTIFQVCIVCDRINSAPWLIEITQGRAGIWPLRYDAEICKISMIINAMDVTNGCLYITKFDSEEVPFKSGENFNKTEAFNEALTEAMPKILKRQASVVIKSLDEESWTGRILDISKGVIKINAGKDVVHELTQSLSSTSAARVTVSLIDASKRGNRISCSSTVKKFE